MIGSSSHSDHTSNSTSKSLDEPQESYHGVSNHLCPSTALSLPEDESPEAQSLEMGGPYPARKLPNLEFIPTSEGSLLRSIHTRIASLQSSTNNAQSRCSQAINSSTPQDTVSKMTTTNLWWNLATFFTEEEAAPQLLRYREVFVYLSQRHAESLASSPLYQAQSFVRRGQVAIAATRIAGCRSWKSWREITLTKKISERRSKRAAKEREKNREKSLRRTRTLRGHEDKTRQEYREECGGRIISQGRHNVGFRVEQDGDSRKYWKGPRLQCSVKRVQYCDNRHQNTAQSITKDNDSTSASSSDSSQAELGNKGPSTDGAGSQEGLMPTDDSSPPGWKWPPKAKEEIIWHIPVYHNAKSTSLTSKSSGPMVPTTATVSNGGDSFLRVHTINEPSGMGYVSFLYSKPRFSPQISPKSQASPDVLPRKDVSGLGVVPATSGTEDLLSLQLPAPLSRQSSISFTKVFEHMKRSQRGSDDSNSDSTVGALRKKNPLRKVKTVFKSFPLKNVHFPWSSSSEEEQISAESSIDPSISEESWPSNGNIPPGYGLVPPPFQLKYQPYAEFFDEPTPKTRIHSPQPKSSRKNNDPLSPPHPGTKLISKIALLSNTALASERLPAIQHRESDPLTRTEKEYQEILSTLNELKRERRARRSSKSKSRERAVNRGFRRAGEERSRSQSRHKNRRSREELAR